MTIGELIENLTDRDQSLLVMVQGYEGGFSTPILNEQTITLDVNFSDDYYGLHDEAGHKGEQASALILTRQSGRSEAQR